MKTFLLCLGACAVLFGGTAIIQYQGVIKKLSFDQVPAINTVLSDVDGNSIGTTTRSLMD